MTLIEQITTDEFSECEPLSDAVIVDFFKRIEEEYHAHGTTTRCETARQYGSYPAGESIKSAGESIRISSDAMESKYPEFGRTGDCSGVGSDDAGSSLPISRRLLFMHFGRHEREAITNQIDNGLGELLQFNAYRSNALRREEKSGGD